MWSYNASARTGGCWCHKKGRARLCEIRPPASLPRIYAVDSERPPRLTNYPTAPCLQPGRRSPSQTPPRSRSPTTRAGGCATRLTGAMCGTTSARTRSAPRDPRPTRTSTGSGFLWCAHHRHRSLSHARARLICMRGAGLPAAASARVPARRGAQRVHVLQAPAGLGRALGWRV